MLFLRYAVAGSLATSVHYAVLVALIEEWGVAGALAALVGATAGAIVSYLINRQITFSGSTAGHQRALPRFMGIALLGILLNGAVVWAGVQLGVHYLVAQAMGTVLVLVVTFQLNQRWSFAP